MLNRQIPRGHLISLPPKVYDTAIRAALRQQDKLFGTNEAMHYDMMDDDTKKKLQEVWMTGFSALLRAWL